MISARRRLVPSNRQSRRASSGDSRNAVTSRSRRCAPPARVRSPTSPWSGSGELREPVQKEREQLLHEPRGAREPPRELAERLAGALGVGEAEGGEALLGRVGRKAVAAGLPLPVVPVAHATAASAKASSSGRKNSRSWMARLAP